jgi:hypothetical protein
VKEAHTVTPAATSSEERTPFREQEAALVAELLRISRLTILFGERGAGKSTLLKRAVLPLLGRRTDDRYARRRYDGIVIPFPERRRTRDRPIEIAMYFDSSSDAPLLELQTRVASALIMRRLRVSPPFPPLAEGLARWSADLGVRFLFILDHFDTLAGSQRDKAGARAFEDALVDVVNAPSLTANVLIAVRDENADALARYRARIPGFGDASVRLPHHGRPVQNEATLQPDVGADVPIVLPIRRDGDDAPRDTAAGEADAPAASTRDWPGAAAEATASESALETLREWDATVQRPHATTQEALDVLREWHAEDASAGEPASPASGSDATASPGDVAQPATTAVPPDGKPRRKALRVRRLVLVVSAILLALAATRLMEPTIDEPAPERAAPERAAPERAASESPSDAVATVATPVVDPRPRLAVAVDAGNGTDTAIVEDLARIALPDAPFAVVPLPGVARVAASAPVAITSFDVLRPPPESRRAAGSESDGFAIVTPLYTEEVHAIVRRDSPRRALHEMRDARINIGPAGSGSRVTALRLYARMFGAPPAAFSELAHDEALSKLLNERSLDVVLVVAAQPVKWLEALPRDVGASIRLLHAEPGHASTVRAVEDYLPARIRAGEYRWLDGDVASLASMAFMVADPRADVRVRDEIAALAAAMCRRLPELRARGHPKWREVQPGLRLDAGWRLWPPAQSAFDVCAANAVAGAAAVQPTLSRQGAAR